MGLLDGYLDPEEFRDGGGLLGRLLSLQQQQGQYQPDSGFAQPLPAPPLPKSAVPWPVPRSYAQVPSNLEVVSQDPLTRYAGTTSGPNNPTLNSNQSDIQQAGVTSDKSVYCRTMRNLCHQQCFDLIFGRDAFGPYRACVRTCMHAAGCFDF
jgi:hypothetical protein